ncbi:PST-A protein [Plasmodium vivax Brazil I]|uniref:PST-A protein n=1 Tax=Plasmodium vivax (strain Brazil I) TaxID=1033975 RepID=A0A0J9VEE6_PLAV1|nr:PST-A protein [Plasmodium vivax Brazil I]
MAGNIYYDEEIITPSTDRLDGKPTLGSFFNKDGLLMRTFGWLVRNAVGVIVLVHGLNSHARLTFLRHNVEIVDNSKAILKDENNYYVYKNSWIEHFNNNGYSVYALDLQGHGLSDGWKNLSLNINNFDDLVLDVIQFLNIINDELCLKDKENDSKATWYNVEGCAALSDGDSEGNSDECSKNVGVGQSMGGNIVLRTLQLLEKTQNDGKGKLNIQGCISLSSMISFQKIASPRSYKYKYFYLPFSRLISGFFPTSRVVTKMEFQKYPYLNDLANFDKIRSKNGITVKYWYELLKATSNLESDMEFIPKDIPILLIHSKDDIFCYYKGALSFFNRLNNDNKELITLENMEHGLTAEPGNEKVLENIVDWIENLHTKKEMAQPLEAT